jgi:hypothetical protein
VRSTLSPKLFDDVDQWHLDLRSVRQRITGQIQSLSVEKTRRVAETEEMKLMRQKIVESSEDVLEAATGAE